MELRLSLDATKAPVHIKDFGPEMRGKRAQPGSVEQWWLGRAVRKREESPKGA